MKESLKLIEQSIAENNIKTTKVKELHMNFIKNELKALHCIDSYIGDYPTFIEPVHLGKNVKIGDDVLIGPNVYIGDNCEIEDNSELMNTIIFDNVIIGENFKLENCIIQKESKLTFKNFKAFNSILKGTATSEKDLTKITF